MAEDAARVAFNMKVLKRHDPSIVEIVGSAAFVVLYEHDDEWTKLGIEGPMFLYRRSTTPSYGFFVLNRNGVENYSANLTIADDLELTSDFIIYRASPDDQVLGIWVYDAKERESVGASMVKIHAASSEGSAANTAQPSSTSSAPITQQQTSSGGQPISLDALFGSSATPQSATAPAALSGPALLNSIFQSASPRLPSRAPAQQNAGMDVHNDMSDAGELKALLGLPNAQAPSAPAQPPKGLEALFASARISPHAVNQTTASLPPKPPSQSTPPTQGSSASKFAATASDSLDESIAQRSLANAALDRREFVREVLSLIHTDKDFVDGLYQRYLTRTG